jgi:hypothetical protein
MARVTDLLPRRWHVVSQTSWAGGCLSASRDRPPASYCYSDPQDMDTKLQDEVYTPIERWHKQYQQMKVPNMRC